MRVTFSRDQVHWGDDAFPLALRNSRAQTDFSVTYVKQSEPEQVYERIRGDEPWDYEFGETPVSIFRLNNEAVVSWAIVLPCAAVPTISTVISWVVVQLRTNRSSGLAMRPSGVDKPVGVSR
jgi:hypothetical protein